MQNRSQYQSTSDSIDHSVLVGDMRNRLPKVKTYFLCILSFACILTAYPQSETKKTVEVKTNVLVTDEKGNYAAGVKESDIKVFESDVEQKLTSFVQLDGPVDIAIVADNTGSVRTQLDDVIKIGKRLVANLKRDDRAQIIRFVNRDKITIEQEWTKDIRELNESLENLYVQGGQSAVLDALYLSSQDILERQKTLPNRRSAIVLISDGEDRDSYYTEKELFKLLEKSRIQIFSITLTKELPKSFWSLTENRKTVGWVVKFVNRLAAETGGTSYIFKEKSTDDDLNGALKNIFTELRSQFVIGYTSTNVTKETNVRKLTVTVANGENGEKRQAFIKDTIVMVPPKN